MLLVGTEGDWDRYKLEKCVKPRPFARNPHFPYTSCLFHRFLWPDRAGSRSNTDVDEALLLLL